MTSLNNNPDARPQPGVPGEDAPGADAAPQGHPQLGAGRQVAAAVVRRARPHGGVHPLAHDEAPAARALPARAIRDSQVSSRIRVNLLELHFLTHHIHESW